MTSADARKGRTKAERGRLYPGYIKRILDAAGALLLLVPSLPVVGISALLIRADSDGPAFFSQIRIGRNGRPFRMYKLRTMSLQREAPDGRMLEDRERITRIGGIVRKFSIDELPQLLNILKGEMSFIGPRPLIPRYLPYYTKEEMRRHEVLPGITGLAQINGRRHLNWEERFAYDVAYVDAVSVRTDWQILWRTLGRVIQGSDTSAGKQADFPDLDECRNNAASGQQSEP